MNESILRALIQLFALVIDNDESEKHLKDERDYVESFLRLLISSAQVPEYIKLYDEHINTFANNRSGTGKRKKKRLMVDAMKIMAICEEINGELEQDQKMYVILKLLEFVSVGQRISEQELDFLLSVATAFNIDETEYNNCKDFVFDNIDGIAEKNRILVVHDADSTHYNAEYTRINPISGSLAFLHISSTNTIAFLYRGKQDIYLNGQNITPGRINIFETGSSIRGANLQTIYYTDVVKVFLGLIDESTATLFADQVRFRFKRSENGVRMNRLFIDSGQLVGVMGASGAGKSTLLNILNGNLKPQQGQVFVNGIDLYDEDNADLLNGIIGYVPQDDILFEELTVFQNLFFNAQLCLDNLSEEDQVVAVESVLHDLDLFDVKDLVVGNVLNKFISGGQRKRLNIALELIREPSILFVDEPTSGLSSLDSETVMNLLKEQTLKGKIVIVNIHQPSSDIYVMFDQMVFLDKGGYLIYAGNPLDAIGYFKSRSNYVNADEEQCFQCGNVNPEQMLQIIEAKVVNEYGKLTRTRKIAPEEWYAFFKDSQKELSEKPDLKTSKPKNLFRIPDKWKQFTIFSKRDLFSKLANKQYMLISMLEAPVLAVFLGFFTKYISGLGEDMNAYVFMENVNIPAFIFMAVVVALFIGLSISAEEIIKDRKNLKREAFLGLSRNSYLHSKISLLFGISAIQMLAFVLLGNLILEIRGMTLHYWLILFTTACFANLLGLLLSSALNSVITIYILIPFILVPELLFSGVFVKYEKLHKSISTPVFVPVIGDVMTSRWAYEALMVHQYNNNKFEKNFTEVKETISTTTYYKDYLIPELQDIIFRCYQWVDDNDKKISIDRELRLLNNELLNLEEKVGLKMEKGIELNLQTLNIQELQKVDAYLEQAKGVLMSRKRKASSEYDDVYYKLMEEMGGRDAVVELRQKYDNKTIADMVTSRDAVDKLIREGDRLVQMKDPVYRYPESKIGRAHFYASVKRIGNYDIDTYWFNLIFIWFTSLLLYLALRYDLLRRVVDSLGKK